MQIQDHIISNLPVLNIGDSLKKAIRFFKDNSYSHVAVTENGLFTGLLSSNDLEDFQNHDKIEAYRYNLDSFFVRESTTWVDVLASFAINEANLVPVLDEDGKVKGYYLLDEVINVFIDTPFFKEPGAVLIVAKGIKDYSFSEIAQIVESNNSRFIGGFISDNSNDIVQVTIKIGTTNLNEISQTFRRYNYNILFGNNGDQFLEDLKQRSDYLDKYLNV